MLRPLDHCPAPSLSATPCSRSFHLQETGDTTNQFTLSGRRAAISFHGGELGVTRQAEGREGCEMSCL